MYIIVGGLGGLGLRADPLAVGQRCRPRNPDIEDRPYNPLLPLVEQAEQLLNNAALTAPVTGIFNVALVQKGDFMNNMSKEEFAVSCAPKVMGTRHLDELSRVMCSQLEHFVCFSSIASCRGIAGSSSYDSQTQPWTASACRGVLMDCQWGYIGQAGIAHRHMSDDVVIDGMALQTVRSCMKTLDYFLSSHDCPVVTSYVTSIQMRKSVRENALTQIAKILGTEDISMLNANRTLSEMGSRFPAEGGIDARHRVLLRYIAHRPTAGKDEGRRYQSSLRNRPFLKSAPLRYLVSVQKAC
ncbi:fatty acid synthase [Caerostris extrusa]|uniref:Fatty acid synthase n=1 Tax=Caerostris extrusa TaxID=172846 RepID=A0AAV4M7D0_CAEEX|nr:fatty acid synthase [Caerostris extrusa]